jgi:hypothetical protein
MSDHIDGPRTTADPAIDLTDLFAFASPSDPKRTVLVANVFPFAGATALFSNAATYAIVVRRVQVAGTGDAARFEPHGPEIRFSFQFEALAASGTGDRPRQTGACRLPDGRTLPVTVNDEAGQPTPDRQVRVFAGLRSDPFFIGWIPGPKLISLPNYIQEDNVLSLVVEFDTAAFLPADVESLFGVVAETTPRGGNRLGGDVPRFDWVGRPEQTNFRLNGVPGAPDLRDLWNQQTPFSLGHDVRPLFRQRLTDSFRLWDIKDGKLDWTPTSLDANVTVFLDDFLLFDVRKPIDDASHLEIERSVVNGKPYETGGGRTLDANVIDILVTWLVNRDRGPFWQGGATQATQRGGTRFPYVRPPNEKLLTITRDLDLTVSADAAWALAGQFGGRWHPLFADVQVLGSGIGQLRYIETVDGKIIVERLQDLDQARRVLTYTLVSGIPAARYKGMIAVKSTATGSMVTWTVGYRPEGQGDLIVHTIIDSLLAAGLDGLKARLARTP